MLDEYWLSEKRWWLFMLLKSKNENSRVWYRQLLRNSSHDFLVVTGELWKMQQIVVSKLTFERCQNLVFYHLVEMRCQPLLIETLLVYEFGLYSSTGGCWNCPHVRRLSWVRVEFSVRCELTLNLQLQTISRDTMMMSSFIVLCLRCYFVAIIFAFHFGVEV